MLVVLPFPDFVESTGVLSYNDLIQLRKDIIKVLDIRHQVPPGWKDWQDHPAATAWMHHEVQLCEYGLIVCEELKARKLVTRDPQKHSAEPINQHIEWATNGDFSMDKPWWFGQIKIHDSHKAELCRRNPWYKSKFKNVNLYEPVYWPLPVKKNGSTG